MNDDTREAWLQFTIQDTDEFGVSIPRITRLLSDLSAALHAIARVQLGEDEVRPGRPTDVEAALASIRLVRIVPGSTTMEFAPPATQGDQMALLPADLNPDEIAIEFLNQVEQIETGEFEGSVSGEVRRRVKSVIDDAGAIGPRAEIVLRPRKPGRRTMRRKFKTRDLPEAVEPTIVKRTRRLSGHTYMVDVEPGRIRMRIKLPDGRDTTINVDDELAAQITSAVDRVVELEVTEEVEGTALKRSLDRISLLPVSGEVSDRPPKTLEQLAEEQGLIEDLPDYVELASAVWRTTNQLASFQEHIRLVRQE